MHPQLVFRVGVTGARDLSQTDLPRLRAHVREILTALRHDIAALAKDPAIDGIYAAKHTHPPIELRLISPLAEGTDRLVAEEGLALGYRLVAPLPFEVAEYERDFPDTLEAFRKLLSQAEVIELDGGREAVEAESYEAVGRFVVRNCDVLIAIWDGAPARGRGGTAEVVQYAALSEMPIWWLHTTDLPPRLIYGPAAFRRLQQAAIGEAASATFRTYLKSLILPPETLPTEAHGIIGQAVRWVGRLRGEEKSPFEAYVDEPRSLSSGGLWTAYSIFIALIGSRGKGPEPQPTPALETPFDHWWSGYFEHADALSVAYGERYRSSYVLVIGLAFLTVAASVLGHVLFSSIVALRIEIVLVILAVTLIVLNHARRWHERWISYRLFAELCRKQMMLSPVGRTLPGFELNILAAGGETKSDAARAPRSAWVGWYFRAIRRGERLSVPLAEAKQDALALGLRLVDKQIDYHRNRRRRAEAADRRLTALVELFYTLTIVGLFLRLIGYANNNHFFLGEWIESVATLFSAASAGLVGLRTYGEFSLLAQQSSLMERLILDMKMELEVLDPKAPLSSQELGSALQRLAVLLMQEVRGWAQLFRLKSIETI